MPAKRTKQKWSMPPWMEKYRPFLDDPTRVEEFLSCDGVNCNVIVNAPRALLCQSMNSQVSLLERLKKGGML